MAIVTPNLGLTIPAMGDAPNMGVVSQALEDIDTYVGKVEERTADAYSDSASYAENDLCIHDNKLYKCSTAITGGEAWNSSHWTETSLADEIGSLNDQIATKADASNFDFSSQITKWSIFSDSGHNIFIIRGFYGTNNDSYLQLVANNNDKKLRLNRKVGSGSEETLITWSGT